MGLLDDKVVLVTGAGHGIGEATAYHLHDEGASVVATARSAEDAEKLAKAFDDERWIARQLDVTDETAVSAAVSFATNRFGRLDGIVNNAAVLVPNDVAAATVEEYNYIFDVNVKGVFLGSKYAIPALLAAGGGSIVNIGSINSISAEKQLALYTASKGAVAMLTKAIALDYGAQGIRANTLCPGFVDTKINVPHYNKLGGREALEAALADFQPIGRDIAPVEIGYSAAFLLSDRSKAITGTAFIVDGGVLCKA